MEDNELVEGTEAARCGVAEEAATLSSDDKNPRFFAWTFGYL